jgi:hypothetical protein
MHRTFKFASKVSIFVFVLTGVIMLAGFNPARAQQCGVGIGKTAEGAGDLEFHFTTHNPGGDGEFTLIDGQGTGGPFTDFIEIRELPTRGWVLSDVICDSTSATVTRIQDGVRIECDEQGGGAECNFINVPFTGTNIPTLSEWGMIAAAAGLALVGVFFAVRRKKINAQV